MEEVLYIHVIVVMLAFLKNEIWIDILDQFMKERNHLNCNICDWAFSTTNQFMIKKPYKCNICNTILLKEKICRFIRERSNLNVIFVSNLFLLWTYWINIWKKKVIRITFYIQTFKKLREREKLYSWFISKPQF